MGHRHLAQHQHHAEQRPQGVTCVSASDCWAVGYYNGNSVYQTLIEHWDGTSWAIVTSPNTLSTELNVFRGVTCVSASDCWAVGSSSIGGSTVLQTLIEHWDGSSWAIVTSPNPAFPETQLPQWRDLRVGVGLLGRRLLLPTAASYQTLIEHWDGTSWAIVTSPNTSATQNNFLNGVTCVSASDCWAVGSPQRQQQLSDPHRAVGRDLVGHRHLAQHQRHAEQLPLWRDVRVGVGLLGRRQLLHRRHQRRPDPHRTLGRNLVGHRHLAQHQRHAEQRPSMA